MADTPEGGEKGKIRSYAFKHFAEEHPDGFADETPRWVAYCPDCGARLPLQKHEECAYYAGEERDEKGNVMAVRCSLCSRD
jgi:hypothetical protein